MKTTRTVTSALTGLAAATLLSACATTEAIATNASGTGEMRAGNAVDSDQALRENNLSGI